MAGGCSDLFFEVELAQTPFFVGIPFFRLAIPVLLSFLAFMHCDVVPTSFSVGMPFLDSLYPFLLSFPVLNALIMTVSCVNTRRSHVCRIRWSTIFTVEGSCMMTLSTTIRAAVGIYLIHGQQGRNTCPVRPNCLVKRRRLQAPQLTASSHFSALLQGVTR